MGKLVALGCEEEETVVLGGPDYLGYQKVRGKQQKERTKGPPQVNLALPDRESGAEVRTRYYADCQVQLQPPIYVSK